MDIYAARIDELIKKGENPSFRSRSKRWKNGTYVTRLVERAKTSFGPGSRDIKKGRSREGEGKGPGSVVSPRCVSLAFDVGCCVLFEYPLESWLCRSFGLGRKALTSAFHSESTTGHVDHSLLRNTYLRASSSSLYRPSPSILSSPSTRLPSPFTSLFPLSHRLDSFR